MPADGLDGTERTMFSVPPEHNGARPRLDEQPEPGPTRRGSSRGDQRIECATVKDVMSTAAEPSGTNDQTQEDR